MADHGRAQRRRRDFARTQDLLCATAQSWPVLAIALASAWLLVSGARAQAPVPTTTPTPATTLTLEQAIQRALIHNEAPRTAEQRARAAEAREDRARSLFFPDLTATGSYLNRPNPAERPLPNGDVLVQERDVWTTTIGMSLNLIDPRAYPLNSQAQLEHDAAELQADESRRTLTFDVARAYIRVLGLEQVQRAAEQRLWLAGRIMDGARARFGAGLSSSNDVTRAELERASAQRELARSRGDVRSARLELGYLIGAEVSETLVAPPAALDATTLPQANAERLSREARARRKDLAASIKRADALDSAADEPTARWFPILSLNAQYRATTEEFFGRNDEITAGALLTWVLWDGGERSADRDERVALALASELETEALSRRVGVDVRQALNQLERGQIEAVEADAAATAARKNMDETRELYRQGLLQSLAVADAALQLFASEVELVRARYGIATALLDLRAALGLDPFGKEPR